MTAQDKGGSTLQTAGEGGGEGSGEGEGEGEGGGRGSRSDEDSRMEEEINIEVEDEKEQPDKKKKTRHLSSGSNWEERQVMKVVMTFWMGHPLGPGFPGMGEGAARINRNRLAAEGITRLVQRAKAIQDSTNKELKLYLCWSGSSFPTASRHVWCVVCCFKSQCETC